MGGKIDCYLDIGTVPSIIPRHPNKTNPFPLASLYSYLAFLELQKNRDLLASHNVQVEY
jgi:hypothetical protein